MVVNSLTVDVIHGEDREGVLVHLISHKCKLFHLEAEPHILKWRHTLRGLIKDGCNLRGLILKGGRNLRGADTKGWA